MKEDIEWACGLPGLFCTCREVFLRDFRSRATERYLQGGPNNEQRSVVFAERHGRGSIHLNLRQFS